MQVETALYRAHFYLLPWIESKEVLMHTLQTISSCKDWFSTNFKHMQYMITPLNGFTSLLILVHKRIKQVNANFVFKNVNAVIYAGV